MIDLQISEEFLGSCQQHDILDEHLDAEPKHEASQSLSRPIVDAAVLVLADLCLGAESLGQQVINQILQSPHLACFVRLDGRLDVLIAVCSASLLRQFDLDLI